MFLHHFIQVTSTTSSPWMWCCCADVPRCYRGEQRIRWFCELFLRIVELGSRGNNSLSFSFTKHWCLSPYNKRLLNSNDLLSFLRMLDLLSEDNTTSCRSVVERNFCPKKRVIKYKTMGRMEHLESVVNDFQEGRSQ